ncbi:hypothetical protein ACFQ1E_11320 [Sphingomonas canadensis]|uniref:Uncharacterized protein n=2 Tax=Sphingomonas canadensis TaxID=1219257 RepID=A0ABW3H8A3_9SPHN|nr:hypothetical protein [Sphingomonas canadensis]MCW3836289.1 hypothetical protein [Sphingomonas canadensis]
MGKLFGVAIAAVTMVAVASPAEAQRWGGRHRHHDRVDGGDLLLGALLAGGLIAVISSADKAERNRRDAENYDYPPPPRPAPPPPAWLPNSNAPADGYDAPPADYGTPSGGYAIANADDAADACAGAALSEGQRLARVASIGAIDAVDPVSGGWSVRGSILLREDYRKRGTERPFTCSISGSAAPSVRIEGY